MVGRDYQPPQVVPPAAYSEPAAGGDAPLPAWWEAFGDPGLNQLVTSGLIHNQDIRLALEEMKSLGLSMEVAEAVGRLWEVVIRETGADSDFTSAIKPIEKRAGVVVGGGKGGIAGK